MQLHRACPFVVVFALAASACAQNVKPGLYENTSQVNWQRSPLPPGMTLPPGTRSPFSNEPHTTQVCVTQEQIDRYGPVIPEQWGNSCHLVNVVKASSGMQADLVCTGGEIEGRGTFEANWTPQGGGSGKVHFVGEMVTRDFSAPIEFTTQLTSVYKGSNCGTVSPESMPTEQIHSY